MASPARTPRIRWPWPAYLSGGFGLGLSAMLGLLVPLRAHELGIPMGAIGLIVAARSASEVLLAMPLSAVIVRLGSRAAFVIGTAGAGLVSAAFVVAEGFWGLLVLNAAMGATRSLGWVASQQYISSHGRPENRARDTGRFSFVSNAGQIVTPLLGGAAATVFGYRPAFLAVAAYCICFTVIGALLSSRGTVEDGSRAGPRAVTRLLRIRRIRLAMLLTFVRLWIPNVWTPFYPLLLVAAGSSPQVTGAVLSTAAVAATVVNLTTGRLSRYTSPELLCTVALGISAGGLLLSPHMLSGSAPFLVAALIGIGNGLSLPLLILLVSDASPVGHHSLALALRNTVNALSGTLAPLGVGPLVALLGAAGAFSLAGSLAGALLAGAALLQCRRTAHGRLVDAEDDGKKATPPASGPGRTGVPGSTTGHEG